uniref:DUF4817 domain-containing protein n=1 Tax=Strigamia maritima TaxID=126957 RepID=T1J3W6_STRMM
MVQRNYRQQYARQPPCKQTIRQWFQRFLETGSMKHRKRSGRPRTSDEHIEEVSQKFQRSLRTSLRRASLQLNIPLCTLHRIIRKKLNYHAYKLQMVQEPLPTDRPQQKEFGKGLLEHPLFVWDKEKNGGDPSGKLFPCAVKFYLSGKCSKALGFMIHQTD